MLAEVVVCDRQLARGELCLVPGGEGLCGGSGKGPARRRCGMERCGLGRWVHMKPLVDITDAWKICSLVRERFLLF